MSSRGWPDACVPLCMIPAAANVLLCDDDRGQIEPLVVGLAELGHSVTVARSCAEAFAAACREDFDVLVAAPYLRDGTALILPRALGIRRPRVVVLITRLSERVARTTAHRVGFDAQLTKIVDADRLDRVVRATIGEPVRGDTLEAWISPR